jgi:hypothetical protein
VWNLEEVVNGKISGCVYNKNKNKQTVCLAGIDLDI